jgi:GDPmannose 4,6-dehydratase
LKTAVIIGITGQDGLYATELLLSKNYRIVGVVRNMERTVDDFFPRFAHQIELVHWDMVQPTKFVEILARFKPDEVYNFAGFSTGKGMFDDAVAIGDINGLAVARILEAIRQVNSNIRFCQASSSEMFGDAVARPQSETTPFNPRSPYGAAKLYAHSMIRIYRQHYGLFACSAILFNHESPRRGQDFVTRKVAQGVARIKLRLEKAIHLGNLESRRDWGFAGDYVRGMWLMLQQTHADDYVLATGQTHSVRELCEFAFSHVGLDYRHYVREDANSYRPTEALELMGDASKARLQLGWAPEVEFRGLVSMMVDAELAVLEKKNLKITGDGCVQEN